MPNPLSVRYIVLSILSLSLTPCVAQRHEIINHQVRSLQVIANEDWQQLPIMELGNGSVTISFDDLTHTYRRLAYRLQHCEADWSISTSLFDSDYCNGFVEGNTIDDVEESILTNTLYTHYSLTLPNEHCAPKISGNYLLTIYDENNGDEPILTACFMVVEPVAQRMGVSLNMTTRTDASINQQHQQLEMELKYANYKVTQPADQIHTVLLQNQRWDDARIDARPQYIMSDGLRWSHCPQYIFEAGNEYRKFEILQTDVASMGIDCMSWDGSQYHAYPFLAQPRPNYLYDVDADGAFLIRNSENDNADNEADYVLVHFQYACPEPYNDPVYLNGNFTYDRFPPDYQMEYDAESHIYECVVPLKLGYYNYQFLRQTSTDTYSYLPSEGNFYQTENKYQALVYYREMGGRTDRLVGYNEWKP